MCRYILFLVADMREPRLPAAQEGVRRLEAMNNIPAFACILSILKANLKFSIQVELRTIKVGVMNPPQSPHSGSLHRSRVRPRETSPNFAQHSTLNSLLVFPIIPLIMLINYSPGAVTCNGTPTDSQQH